MVSFPHCKINLGLRILRKREDGYHDLETVFYPLPVEDVLEITTLNDRSQESGSPSVASAKGGVGSQETIQNSEDHSRLTTRLPDGQAHHSRSWILDTATLRFNQTGLEVDGNPEDNLCTKAYYLLKKEFPLLPSIQMHLHKNIPMGAGLGGGSADAAFVLKQLNTTFNLNLTTEQLIAYALQLGSDCPFFIIDKPCWATGRGEILEPLQLDLSAYSFMIVSPGLHISTSWAFSMIKTSDASFSIKEIIQKPVITWKGELVNDFEAPVFNKHPEIKIIKDTLYQKGAIYASMTGSGSSVFALFPKNQLPSDLFPKTHYRIDMIS